MKMFFIGLILLLIQLPPIQWQSEQFSMYLINVSMSGSGYTSILNYLNFILLGQKLIVSFLIVFTLFKYFKLSSKLINTSMNRFVLILGILLTYAMDFPIIDLIWISLRPNQETAMLFVYIHQLGETFLLIGLILFFTGVPAKKKDVEALIISKKSLMTSSLIFIICLIMLVAFNMSSINLLIFTEASHHGTKISIYNFITSLYVLPSVISTFILLLFLYKISFVKVIESQLSKLEIQKTT